MKGHDFDYLIGLLNREITRCGLDSDAGLQAFFVREKLRDNSAKFTAYFEDTKATLAWRKEVVLEIQQMVKMGLLKQWASKWEQLKNRRGQQ